MCLTVCNPGWRAEAEGTSRVGRVLKAVLTVEQGGGQQGAVVLWGAALTWLQRINRNKGKVRTNKNELLTLLKI